MQDKYIEHYTAVIFDRWFKAIAKETGDSPFRAVIQNHMYTQDPQRPQGVRIQTFINGLVAFWKQASAMEDPDPAPTVFTTDLAENLEEEAATMKRFIDDKKAEKLKAEREKQAAAMKALGVDFFKLEDFASLKPEDIGNIGAEKFKELDSP